MRELEKPKVYRVCSLQHINVRRLKLDGRRRSKTTSDGNGHVPVAHHEQLSVQNSVNDGNTSRPRSYTAESGDQFVVVDTISIDDSVSSGIISYILCL